MDISAKGGYTLPALPGRWLKSHGFNQVIEHEAYLSMSSWFPL